MMPKPHATSAQVSRSKTTAHNERKVRNLRGSWLWHNLPGRGDVARLSLRLALMSSNVRYSPESSIAMSISTLCQWGLLIVTLRL